MNMNKTKKRIIILYDLLAGLFIILGMYMLFFKTVGLIIGDDYHSNQFLKGIILWVLLAIFLRCIFLLTRIWKERFKKNE